MVLRGIIYSDFDTSTVADKRRMCRHIRGVMAGERRTRFLRAWKGCLRCSVGKRDNTGLERGVPKSVCAGQRYDGDMSPGLHLRVLFDNLPTRHHRTDAYCKQW